MKLILTCVLMSFVSFPVFAVDIFFKGDANHFIKVDQVRLKFHSYTKLSSCKVADLAAQVVTAECKELAMITAKQFEEVKKCASIGLAGHAALSSGLATVSVGLIAGSIMSGGSMSELGFLLVLASGGAAAVQAGKAWSNYVELVVFSEETAKDQDWTMSIIDHSTLMSQLSMRLDCTKDLFLFPVKEAPYPFVLNAKQVQELSEVNKQKAL